MFNLEKLTKDLKKLKCNSFGVSRKNYTPRRRVINPCGICREQIHPFEMNNGTALYTPCQHLFHRDCLCQWLMVNQTCPICRNPFSEHQVRTMCPPDRYGRPTIKRKVLGERRNNINIYNSGPNAVRLNWDGQIIN
jgi:hypothetical protein